MLLGPNGLAVTSFRGSLERPGRKHEEICEKFKNKKELSEEEEAFCKGSVHDLLPKARVACHIVEAHKEHPEFEREKKGK